ncbi:unnamed protein product [Mycena citricolor]|uniref:Uncharacterized protein n=1 Tax=Mycena citricolor TaxID=2018698 RepID=A0AAD2HPX6_9AGAR|nr:unnamed protein product [Mycena citricolor]
MLAELSPCSTTSSSEYSFESYPPTRSSQDLSTCYGSAVGDVDGSLPFLEWRAHQRSDGISEAFSPLFSMQTVPDFLFEHPLSPCVRDCADTAIPRDNPVSDLSNDTEVSDRIVKMQVGCEAHTLTSTQRRKQPADFSCDLCLKSFTTRQNLSTQTMIIRIGGVNRILVTNAMPVSRLQAIGIAISADVQEFVGLGVYIELVVSE